MSEIPANAKTFVNEAGEIIGFQGAGRSAQYLYSELRPRSAQQPHGPGTDCQYDQHHPAQDQPEPVG